MSKLATPPDEAHTVTDTAQFCLVGRFLSFLPGEKSPYQIISFAIASNSHQENYQETHQIQLDKNLQRMMYRYLVPQDWIRVVGTQEINRRSGQIEWKATEVSKLSLPQMNVLKPSATLPATTSVSQSPRVLICQASGCQQRGSLAVREAVVRTLSNASSIEDIVIQSTGCMKRCKAGPNLVMIPGGSYSQVTTAQSSALIQQMLNEMLN